MGSFAMTRVLKPMAWMLAVWAVLLPTLAAAHDHEHGHDGELEPVLCACAAFSDREDDGLAGPEPLGLQTPTPRHFSGVAAVLDRAGYAWRGEAAIRAPPLA